MIGLGRRLREGDAHVRSGGFQGWRPRLYGQGLNGAAVGLVGLGAVWRAAARILLAFGARLRFVDDGAGEPGPGVERAADLAELLRWSDQLLLCAALTPATLHRIDRAALAELQPHALVVNVARGSLVDEAAVLEALEAGRLGGYAADVFEFEDRARPDRPLAVDPRLLAHPATLFTPHLGSAVGPVRRRIEAAAAASIVDLLQGRLPRDVLNPQARPAHPL